MTVCFLITTYDRHDACQRLVDSLQGLGSIVVLNDGCDYTINGCTQYFQKTHRGKKGYWITVNGLFKCRIKSDYYIILPDDFIPKENMVDRAMELWRAIKDPRKICLSLAEDRGSTPCWTEFPPKVMGDVILTQWVDMCFLCEERFFSVLGQLTETRYNWNALPNISSGVGRQISRRLYGMKYNLYNVKESLVEFQEEHFTSKMHQR